MIIPQSEDAPAVSREAPSKTWLLDHKNRRIVKMTDGADAVLQAAFCAIQTPRYAHPIYSRQYGSELHTLIGRDREYVFSEGRRMITDALSVDPRILSVSGFRMDGDAIVFNIRTAYADTEIGIREGVLL